MKRWWSIGVAALWLAGCAPMDKMTALSEPEAAPQPPPEKSVARQAVEGFTGKTAVDAGQRAKSRVQDINEQRRKNFEEIPP